MSEIERREGEGASLRHSQRSGGVKSTLAKWAALALVAAGGVALFALAFVVAIGLFLGVAALVGIALLMYGFKRSTGRLATIEELAARHGVTPRDIERLLEEQQVRPNVVINGRGMYDPGKLRDVARVARSAGGPVVDVEALPPATEAEGGANREPGRRVEETNTRKTPDD